MKKIWLAGGLIILLAVGLYIGLRISDSKWVGVDESVVEKFAIEANRPPHEPLINIEHGDLPLLLFLLAGAAGGVYSRLLFSRFISAKEQRRTPGNRDLRFFQGIDSREGRASLPPPRDCDRDESRRIATVMPGA